MLGRSKLSFANEQTPASVIRSNISDMVERIYWSVENDESVAYSRGTPLSSAAAVHLHNHLVHVVDALRLNEG